MRRDFTQKVLDFKGQELRFPIPKKNPNDPFEQQEFEEALTFETVALTALLQAGPDLKKEDKLRQFRLARRVDGGKGAINIEAEDSTLLKDCVGRMFNVLIVGRFEEFLENDPSPVETITPHSDHNAVPDPAAAVHP